MSLRNLFTRLSWVLLALAIGALAGVGYYTRDILTEAHLRAQTAAEAEQMVARRAYNERLRSLATETAVDRARLEELAGQDVISIVDAIEDVGRAAGTSLNVSSALPGGAGEEVPGGLTLRPVIFVLEAGGSYARIMQTVALLENLPLPSSIDEVSIRRSGQAGSSDWTASVRLRVYTTTAISS